MEWYFLGWLLFALFIVIIYFLLVIRALTTRHEFDESEEFSGVINVRQNIKNDNSNDDANGLRSKFDRESG